MAGWRLARDREPETGDHLVWGRGTTLAPIRCDPTKNTTDLSSSSFTKSQHAPRRRRSQIRQGGEDPKITSTRPTRATPESEWPPTETKNYPPRGPTSPRFFFYAPLRFTLPLYIPTLALSLPPQQACLLRAACLAVCLSSYLSNSPSRPGSRNARRTKSRAQLQCRRRGSPRWTRPPRG
jgi:hypothetical protein